MPGFGTWGFMKRPDHKEWKFEQSFGDPCVFHCHQEVSTPSGTRSGLLIVGCYVDDLFVLSSHRDEHSLYSPNSQAISLRIGT